MPEPTPEAWAQIRHDYEHTNRPIEDICAEHGISSPTLRYRKKLWQWRGRRPPIPREGPPPVHPTPTVFAAVQTVDPPPPAECEEATAMDETLSGVHAPSDHPTPPAFADASAGDPPPPGEGEVVQADAATIVPRLQSAVARVLPAIEATIARLAAGPHHARDMEQAGRTLSSLTRTLRELNALLNQHNARAGATNGDGDDDDMPEDIDAFRIDLARRIDAFVASRQGEDWEAKPEET